MAKVIKVSLGAMAKAYAAGGVAAAQLASRGYTGPTDVLEGRDGFFQNFGAGVCRRSRARPSLRIRAAWRSVRLAGDGDAQGRNTPRRRMRPQSVG